MSLRPEDFELVRQHLKRFPDQQACPVCHGRTWSAGNLELGNSFDAGARSTQLGVGIPYVTLICEGCAFIRQFAWLAIKRAAAKGLGDPNG